MSIRNVAILKQSLVDVRDQPCADLFLDLFKKAAEELAMSYKDDKCGFTFCSPICTPNTEIVYDSETKELCITVGDSTVCAIIDIDPSVTSEGTPSINISGLGIIGDALTADVNISADAGNTIIINSDGLYSAGADAQNGLNLNSGFVEFGGTLLQDTTIDTSTFELHTIGNNLFYDSFPSTRDDSGSTTPLNFLYTDANGLLLSGGLNYIINNVPVVDTNLFNTDLTATANRIHSNPSFDIQFTGDGKFFYYNQLIPTTSVGTNNTRIGLNAMATPNPSSFSNVLIGDLAGSQLAAASLNVAVGNRALQNATTAGSSVAIGYNAMGSHLTNGPVGGQTSSIGIGTSALSSSTTSAENIAIGFTALTALVTSNSNIGIGHRVAVASTNISENIIIGHSALLSHTSGTNNQNIIIGNEALRSSLSTLSGGLPFPNTVIGFNAGSLLPLSAGNTLIGWKSMEGVSSSGANFNTAIGYNSMKNQSLPLSVAIGSKSMMGPAPSSVAIGHEALMNGGVNGINIAIGSGVLKALTTGRNNTVVGSAQPMTTGGFNSFYGIGAGANVITGSLNTYIGESAGFLSTSANNNTAIGSSALKNNSSGNGNVAIGYRSAENELGSNKLYIANGPSSTTTTGDTIIYGDFTKSGVNNSLNLRFPGYPTSRNNSSSTTPTNFLYTDANGNVLSAPTSLISGGGGGSNTFLNIGAGQGIYESTAGTTVRLKSIKSDGTVSVTSDADEIILSVAGATGFSTVRFGVIVDGDVLTEPDIIAANPYFIIEDNSQYSINIPRVQNAVVNTGTNLVFYIAEPSTEPVKEASLLFRNVSSTFLQEDVNTGPTPLFSTSTIGAYRVYSMTPTDASLFDGLTLGPVILSSPAEVTVSFPALTASFDLFNITGSGYSITDINVNGVTLTGPPFPIVDGNSSFGTSSPNPAATIEFTVLNSGTANMELTVNSIFIECVDVSAAGTYAFSPIVLNNGDFVVMTLSSGTC